jgi:hypothetical protein
MNSADIWRARGQPLADQTRFTTRRNAPIASWFSSHLIHLLAHQAVKRRKKISADSVAYAIALPRGPSSPSPQDRQVLENHQNSYAFINACG